MNINHLIKRIKEKTGLSRFLQTSYTDHDIYDIIINHALKDFERYFKVEADLGVIELNGRRIGSDVILIPDWIIQKVERAGLKVEGVHSIRFTNTFMDRTGIGQMLGHRMASLSLEAAYTANYEMQRFASSDLYYNYVNSCHFEKPNRLRFLWNNTVPLGTSITLSLRLSLAPNLIGVEQGREHTFFELALLSVMEIIYQNEGKYISGNIQSGAGDIDLKIEDWAQAGEKRLEMLETMQNNTILDQNQVKVLGD